MLAEPILAPQALMQPPADAWDVFEAVSDPAVWADLEARADFDACPESDAWPDLGLDDLGLGVPVRDLVAERVSMLALAMGAAGGVSEYAALGDEDLLNIGGILAQEAGVVAAQQAMVAGEVAKRSRPELGLQGLARSRGHRTTAELVRVTTGVPLRQANTAIEVGRLLVPTGEVEPWLDAVGAAVADDGFPVEKAAAIKRGLGTPNAGAGSAGVDGAGAGVDAEVLGLAARALVVEGAGLDADRLLLRARQVRDELDDAGVHEREQQRRQQRSFRLHLQPDGMTWAIWMMDPETAAIITEVVDRATSPKLGGPRFVDSTMAGRAEQISRDPRTAEQLASDVLVSLLQAGNTADPNLLVGVGAPAVRVLVTLEYLTTATNHHAPNYQGANHDGANAGGRPACGVATIEGQTAPVSAVTAERIACTVGTKQIMFDKTGQPLDVGRTSRLFTPKQRIALAARDGGCRFPGCERPPSWTEAHHLRQWLHGGETNINNGILLCRHHHLLVHDNKWEIRTRPTRSKKPGNQGIEFEFIPPATTDPTRTTRPSTSRNGTYRRLLRSRGAVPKS